MPRAALAAAVVTAALSFAPPAAAAAPVITLLTPPNGATIYSSPSAPNYPTFTWHVDWATPEATTVRFEVATDTAFTQNVTVDTHFCDASNPNCWTQIQPRRVFGPPYGNIWFWRVGLTTSAGVVYSPSYTFTALAPPDHDSDGVPDSSDNCPSRKNPSQLDSNHDGKGDACQPDRVRPRVKVYSGSARRGSRAYFRARVADDRGLVRLFVTLNYRGHILYRGRFGWTRTDWAMPATFYTLSPLPGFLPVGRYSACVTAWDKAGNRASSCASYRVR